MTDPHALFRQQTALGKFALPRVVTAFEQVMGHPIAVRYVAPGEAVPGLPPEVAGVLAGLEMFDSPLEMADTARTFGVELTPMETFARRMLVGAGA